MRIALDPQSAKSLVRACDDALVRALFLRRYQRTLAGLLRLEERLAAEAPALLCASRFGEALQLLQTAGAAVQQVVLTYPTAPFWLDVAENLVRRRAHQLFPDAHIRGHLERFQPFAAAAASLAALDYEGNTLTGARGELALPGCGIVCEVACPVPFERVKIVVQNGAVRCAGTRPYVVSAVPRLEGGAELNALDSDLRLPGRTSFPYEELDDMAVPRWLAPLEQAFALVRRADARLVRELRILRSIVPVKSTSADVHVSASFREAPALIALSWTPDSGVLAEAIVHEYHHQKLNALLSVDPLITGPDGDARYYSPWRDDPRPLLGVMHGAFAFQAVLTFWDDALRNGAALFDTQRIRQRMFLVRAQVLRAVEVLEAEAEVTPLGAALVDAIRDSAEAISGAIASSDDAAGRLTAKMCMHESQWSERNGRPAVAADNPPPDPALAQALAVLGLTTASCTLPTSGSDSLLEALMRGTAPAESVRTCLDTYGGDGSFWRDLLEGHVDYADGRYAEAAIAYTAAIAKFPNAPLPWQYLAFALRHERDPLGDRILGSFGAIMTAVRERVSEIHPIGRFVDSLRS